MTVEVDVRAANMSGQRQSQKQEYRQKKTAGEQPDAVAEMKVRHMHDFSLMFPEFSFCKLHVSEPPW